MAAGGRHGTSWLHVQGTGMRQPPDVTRVVTMAEERLLACLRFFISHLPPSSLFLSFFEPLTRACSSRGSPARAGLPERKDRRPHVPIPQPHPQQAARAQLQASFLKQIGRINSVLTQVLQRSTTQQVAPGLPSCSPTVPAISNPRAGCSQ